MIRQRLLRPVLLKCCLGILAVLVGIPSALAQSESGLACTVSTGLDSIWKIGFSTRHRVEIRATQGARGRVEIQTVDGDGVPVRYRNDAWNFDVASGAIQSVEVIAKHGRGNRPIRILLVDDAQRDSSPANVLLEHVLTDSERGTPIPSTQPWVVGIGTDLRLSQGAMMSVGSSLGEYSVSELHRADDLPESPQAYEGVDAMIFSSSNPTLNAEINPEQRGAIATWVRNGGQLVLTWGKGAPELAHHSELAAMIPGQIVGTAAGCEPGPLESLLGSQQQLQPLDCSLLRLKEGRVDVGTVTATRTKFPLLARWAYGMGSVVWLATELDSSQILEWETRSGLLKMLLKDAWEKPDNKNSLRAFQSYDELTGQLNATLDIFNQLRHGNLGQLVLIAGLLALIIGPLDYFLVSRVWKRPRWTWWTLVVASCTTMIAVAFLTRAWKPEMPSINSLELIDIDDQTGILHGRGFMHGYAGRRGVYDFLAHHRSLSPNRLLDSKPQPNRLDWFGQPGKGLGGFDSNVSTQLGLPVYAIESDARARSGILGLGFPAAGTKALFTEWNEAIEIPPGSNALTTVMGKDDLLQGSFTNPLGVDLLDATLYFAGRAYTIPARIRPGERVPITTAIPKDIARRLQRRTFVAGEEQGGEWDAADTNSIDRLAEMLSFHRSAGASAYTGLTNRYLAALESSDLLKLERAVVFGFIAEPVTTWTLRRNQIPVQTIGGKQRSAVRLALRVQNNNPSTSPTREYPIPTNP